MVDTTRVGAVLAVCLLACSHDDVATGRRCPVGDGPCLAGPRGEGKGTHGSAVAGRDGESGSDGGTPTRGAVGTSEDALTVHVADVEGMTIEIITLACAGDCAEVEAVASGGNPPYAFEWEDGSSKPTRRVCLDADAELSVSATDTAIMADEFGYDAHTVDARVTANVLDCSQSPDAGADCGDSVEASFVVTPAEANPSGNWSYGWSPSLGAAFTLYPTFEAVRPIEDGGPFLGPGWPSVAQWYDIALGSISADSYYAVGPVPDVQFNPTASAVHPAEGNLAGSSWTIAPGQFALTPGLNGQLSIARWTASEAGSYAVSAVFEGLCGDNGSPTTTADVHVQHDGSDLAGGSLDTAGAGNTFTFVAPVTVAAGDTIDFAVGSAGGVFICPDVTALHAVVCEE